MNITTDCEGIVDDRTKPIIDPIQDEDDVVTLEGAELEAWKPLDKCMFCNSDMFAWAAKHLTWGCSKHSCFVVNHFIANLTEDKTVINTAYNRGKYKVAIEKNKETGADISLLICDMLDEYRTLYSSAEEKAFNMTEDGKVVFPMFDSEEETENFVEGMRFLK